MTLGTTHAVVSYDGDGTTTEFAVTFEFHTTSDLEVIVVTKESGAESLKIIGIDYDVSGGSGATGTVAMTAAPETTERLVVRRVSLDVQPDDIVEGGPLAAEPLERRLDIIAARLQELEADISRCLKVAKGSRAPESGLTLNLTGGKGNSIAVSNDEQGIVIAAAVAPDDAMLSPKGAEFVGLSTEAAMRSFLELGTAATTDTGTSGATIPLLNGNNAYSGTAVFSGDTAFNGDVVIGAPLVLMSETVTIDANAQITPTKSHVLVSNAGSLSTIGVTNHPLGAIIELRAGTANQWPSLQHQAPGSGNIFLAGGVSVTLDALDKTIWFQHRDDLGQPPGWYEIGRSFPIVTSPFSQIYKSDEELLEAARLSTSDHESGVMPDLLQCRLICKVAENGYAVGDEVIVNTDNASTSTSNSFHSVVVTTSQILIRQAIRDPAFVVGHKSNGIAVNATNANWRLIVRAWA